MDIGRFVRKNVGIGNLYDQKHCICKVSAFVLSGVFIDGRGNLMWAENRIRGFRYRSHAEFTVLETTISFLNFLSANILCPVSKN